MSNLIPDVTIVRSALVSFQIKSEQDVQNFNAGIAATLERIAVDNDLTGLDRPRDEGWELVYSNPVEDVTELILFFDGELVSNVEFEEGLTAVVDIDMGNAMASQVDIEL